MTEPSKDVALRNVPVPALLRDLGIRVADDAASGQRLVLIPKEVRQHVNVIDPVTSLVQADPNWTPRVSLVELDPNPKGPHYYEQAGKKLAPTKQALEVLAKGAGVLSTTTARIPKAELDEGEVGYTATVRIRRSDGTEERITREKVWVSEAERAEIEEAVNRAEDWKDGKPVRGSHKFGDPGSEPWKAEVQKRWLKELKDRYAKTESKAVLRAIRSALQIPHTFTAVEAAKPFLIIGFNFTPDYNDVEIRRQLVRHGLNAATELYGREPVETINLETGELTPAEEPVDVDGAAQAATGADQASLYDVDGQQGEEAANAGGAAAVSSSPGDDWSAMDGESDNKPAWQKAGEDTIVPGGKYEGQSLMTMAASEEGRSWMRRALKTVADPTFRVALEAFVEGGLPDIWAEYVAGKAA